MKLISYTLIIVGLTLPVSLLAQDAPSRPLRDPSSDIEPTPLPKASATPIPPLRATPHRSEPPIPKPSPSSTPGPSPTPTPTSMATPEQSAAEIESTPVKASPTPAQVRTPRRAKKESLAQRKPEPIVEATPLSRRGARAAAAKLKALEEEWEASFNNPAVIEKCLAEDFVGTSPGGQIMTKKALLREAKEDTGPPPKTIARDLDVHFIRPALAIVTGAAKQFDRNRGGQVVEHNYRFTDTWVERDGEWRCVASQSMLMSR